MNGKRTPKTAVLEFDVKHGVDHAVVTLSGECSMEVSEDFRASLLSLAAEKIPVIILDMHRLNFIDSTGLGGIVGAHVKARRYNGSVRLVAPGPSIMEVLALTRLTALFPIFPDVSSALAATDA